MAVETRFGEFVLNHDTRQLLRGGAPVHLAPKAFDLLTALLVERPKALSKSTLMERLWPGTFVARANLSNLIAEVREALGDDPRAPRFIRTSSRFGYAFCGDAFDADDPVESPPKCWLKYKGRDYPLPIGEHIVGRDRRLAVSVDALTVSRRHARIAVSVEGAQLDDLASKNGTFVNDEPIAGPTRLADGDRVHFGTLLMSFHCRAIDDRTETATQPARTRPVSGTRR